MRSKGELSTTLAIAVTVTCCLLLERIDVEFIECLENFELELAETLWPTVLGLPSVCLGRAKVLVDKNCFPISLSKLGYPTKKGKVTELEVFQGPEAYLNLAIICALGGKEPQTTREICKKVNQVNFRKQFSYSTVNRRVRRLEEHFYVKKCKVEKRVGGIANYYELRPKALLAKFLNSTNMSVLLDKVNDETGLTLLGVLFAIMELDSETE